MTLKDIKNAFINLGFESIDINNKREHLGSKSGKVHVLLYPDTGVQREHILIRRYANTKMFAYNMPESENEYLASAIDSIYRNGNSIVIKINDSEKYDYKEATKSTKESADDKWTTYLFELNSRDNIRFITLTDFTASKEVSYAQYYIKTNDWDGDKKDIANIMGVLMKYKLNLNKLKDGFVAIYSNGKWEEME